MTKLYIPPPVPHLVPRPRLSERLNQGLNGRLTLISAPAGYGKTTLISEWLSRLAGEQGSRGAEEDLTPAPLPLRSPTSFSWLSLDEGDNDVNRFLTYLIAALQRINPDIGQISQQLLQAGGPHSPTAETVLAALINDVAANQAESCWVLVLDDYHLIETAAVHEALSFLLNHQPARLHLVIASRTMPPLSLSRLRVRGQLVEIHAADLRFTTAEIAEFLNTRMGLGLSSDDIIALETRTEGWIAGLQLAALSLQEQPDRSGFIKAFSGDDRYILDYLLDEVFSWQPETVQRFLLHTSILDRLCGPLADALINEDAEERRGSVEEKGLPPAPTCPPGRGMPLRSSALSSQTMLEYLEQANLFIVPLDNKREWYRYHRLLLELLRHRLQRLAPALPGGVAALHRRAAAWYVQQGLVAEALAHLFAIEDFAWAAQLVEQVGATILWERGEVATFLSWLAKLPPEIIHARPKLCLYYAETLYLIGQLGGIEPFLRSAELHLHGADSGKKSDHITSTTGSPDLSGDEVKNLQGEVMAIRALVAGTQGQPGQTAEAITLAHRALALLADKELRLRGLLTIGLAEAYYLNGRLSEAAENYTQAIELGQASRNPFLALAGMTRLSEVQLIQGQLRRAAETCQQMRQLALSAIHLPGSLIWSELLREWNQLDAAREQAQQSLHHGELEGNPRIQVQAYVTLAHILQAQGDFAGAHEAIQAAAQLKQQQQLSLTWDLPPVAAHRAMLWLRQKEVAAAASWAKKQDLWPSDIPTYPHELEYLILARLLLAQKRAAEAVDLLLRLQQAAEQGGRMGRVIEALALLALAYQMLEDHPAALTALNRALTLAEPEGYIRLFVAEGPPMASLLERMNPHSGVGDKGGRQKDYILKLLSSFVPPEAENTSDKGETNDPLHPSSLILHPLIEPLTRREQEILHLIAAGLSNAAIARQLFLSMGTVKTHIRNIYGKLGVASRTQALIIARQLGLLD
ncbi:MAG: AAA family ATPase [Anaerolineales bacterium]|nr:AAA family ATPase [Anaerolineales bacterium]